MATPSSESQGGDVRPQRPAPRRRGISILLQLIAMIAIALIVYPDAADWFARLNHDAEISGYVERVDQTPTQERQDILAAAYAYNDTLQPGSLTDPFVSQDPDEARRTAVYEAYEQLLRVSGTDAIGTVNYPRLDIALPVYHGSADATISRGAGHMFGTSMPVGGPSTHAVLTSHSGLPQAKLFTNLLGAEVGDTFWISVLGEDHYYRVESTETVLASDTVSLEITEGEDQVTLFTCAPIGINSHRFMVHAVRIPDPPAATQESIAGDGLTAGVPWWSLWFVGGSAIVGFILFAPARKRRGRRLSTSGTGADVRPPRRVG